MRDDSAFRPAEVLIGDLCAAVLQLDLLRILGAGHWSAYEKAPAVNRAMVESIAS